MSVITVNGIVHKDELGIVASHEHVFIDLGLFFAPSAEISERSIAYDQITMDKLGTLSRNPFAMKENLLLTDFNLQQNELMSFKKAGGRTVVDATTAGIGRDPALLRAVAATTGLNIVAGAGYYVEDAQDEQTKALSVDELEKQIVKELNIGIGHTNIRAGIIGEVGISHIMRPFEKKSLIAACRAQKTTNAPLMIHVNPFSRCGLSALKIINDYGVDTSKVVICHLDVQLDSDYLYQLLDAGLYIEFDNFGKEFFLDRWNCKPGSGRFMTDWQRVQIVKELVDKGYEDQLLFSCDVCLKTLLHAYGGWGYDHVLTSILPMLEEVGVTEQIIEKILVSNPARWLDF